jgi:hypothetical protein
MLGGVEEQESALSNKASSLHSISLLKALIRLS